MVNLADVINFFTFKICHILLRIEAHCSQYPNLATPEVIQGRWAESASYQGGSLEELSFLFWNAHSLAVAIDVAEKILLPPHWSWSTQRSGVGPLAHTGRPPQAFLEDMDLCHRHQMIFLNRCSHAEQNFVWFIPTKNIGSVRLGKYHPPLVSMGAQRRRISKRWLTEGKVKN